MMQSRLISANDAVKLSEFHRRNSEHLRLCQPLRDNSYHSVEAWQARLVLQLSEQAQNQACYFVSIDCKSDEIVAICSLTNIVRGPFQACHMGYAIAEQYQGKGLMKELCNHVICYAFEDLKLHRIMANYMPVNLRSEALLNSLGFIREGVAKKYLKINGQWEDHVLTSLLNPVSA